MSQPHLVLSCKANWSHLRSLCVLATKIVSSSPIVVTILVSNIASIVDKVSAEVKRCLKEEGPPKGFIRVVAVGHDDAPDAGAESELACFRETWKAIMSAEPVKCSRTGAVYESATRPSLLMLDGLQMPWLKEVKSTSPRPPIVQWMMAFSAGWLAIVGPEAIGGRGDSLSAIADNELAHLDDAIVPTPEGKVLHVPGLPALYDWELFPQHVGPQRKKILAAEVMLSKTIRESDGLATNCFVEYDGEACLDSMSDWISKLDGRPTFHLGHMLPFRPGTSNFSPTSLAAEMAMMSNGTGARIADYLDGTLHRYGEQSMFYISFGTEHWPASTAHLTALLYALERRKIPFILAHSYRTAQIPGDVLAHFDGCAGALFTTWAPQQAILAHQACGWFLCHGGPNGTIEAVSQGVPMIAWPFAVDQPANVARLVHKLDVAFELTEVRTGAEGLKPLYNAGNDADPTAATAVPAGTVRAFEHELERILDAIGGEVGKRKRRNVREMQQKFAGASERAGKQLEGFLHRYASGVVEQ